VEGKGKGCKEFLDSKIILFFQEIISPARLHQSVATASVCLSWMQYGFAITALSYPIYQLMIQKIV